MIANNGTTAYVSNEGGRVATESDFQIYSAGTEIVTDPVLGAAITGTISVVDLPSMTVTATISTGGLHPTGMAFYEKFLLVANTYSDTISVINTATNEVAWTINLALPIAVPGQAPAIALRRTRSPSMARKALPTWRFTMPTRWGCGQPYQGRAEPLMGMIPVAYAPASVVLDAAANALLVANDKGIWARYSFECDYGVCDCNTHQDNGTVSIVPVPSSTTLAKMTTQVFQNNHWNLMQNIESAGGGNPHATPVAIPAKIGDPSVIKHVFVIVRENRTYDQVLGDVTAGNGDPSLAVFGGQDTPKVHALVTRFPLFDNFYDPSRQSADGHQWISEGMAPYADDIQSPDWDRSYPGGNGGDALAYTTKGFLFSEAAAAGLPVKMYGEYVEGDTFLTAGGVDQRAELEPVLRRLAVLRGGTRLRSAWHAGRVDTVLPEHGPGILLCPGRAEPSRQELPAVRSGHPRPVPRRPVGAGLQ